MDVSKLPRLSSTSTDASGAPNQAASMEDTAAPSLSPARPEPLPYAVAPTAPIGLGRKGDAMLSIGVGAILLLMYPRFLQWLSSVLFHTNFNQFLNEAGTVVPYPKVAEFWGDLGPTLFGVVLIVEGAALLATDSRAVTWLAFALTVIATAYNAVYVVASFSTYGLAPISALAVLFGGYIAMSQRQQLKMTNQIRQRAR